MKTRTIITTASAIFCLPILAYGAYALHTNSDDYTSRTYVEKVLPVIGKEWSAEAMMMRAHPDMIVRNSEDGIRHFAYVFRSSLGSMTELKECDGFATSVNAINQPTRVTANYHCGARFEKGSGTINIGLLQNQKNEWRIFSFNVDSPALRQ